MGRRLYKTYRHMVLFICINNYKYIYIPGTHLSFVLPPKQGLFQSKQGTLVYIYIDVCVDGFTDTYIYIHTFLSIHVRL